MSQPDGPLTGKFHIERTDGRDAEGEKHAACKYFVLDLSHDPFAVDAILAYVESCRENYPILADSLYNEFIYNRTTQEVV